MVTLLSAFSDNFFDVLDLIAPLATACLGIYGTIHDTKNDKKARRFVTWGIGIAGAISLAVKIGNLNAKIKSQAADLALTKHRDSVYKADAARRYYQDSLVDTSFKKSINTLTATNQATHTALNKLDTLNTGAEKNLAYSIKMAFPLLPMQIKANYYFDFSGAEYDGMFKQICKLSTDGTNRWPLYNMAKGKKKYMKKYLTGITYEGLVQLIKEKNILPLNIYNIHDFLNALNLRQYDAKDIENAEAITVGFYKSKVPFIKLLREDSIDIKIISFVPDEKSGTVADYKFNLLTRHLEVSYRIENVKIDASKGDQFSSITDLLGYNIVFYRENKNFRAENISFSTGYPMILRCAINFQPSSYIYYADDDENFYVKEMKKENFEPGIF